MHIKILVPENRRNDLKRFIDCCTEHGFTVTHSGGGHMPSFSGYFAELKGDKWEMDEPTPKETPVKPPKKLAAVFVRNEGDIDSIKRQNDPEWDYVIIRSKEDILTEIFQKVIYFDGWHVHCTYDVLEAFSALRFRQPELFPNNKPK